jgi:hypothetical protein
VVGNDNVLSGRGFSAIDVRAGASAPTLVSTDTKGWQRRSDLSWAGYLRYHPLLATWLVILALCTVCVIAARCRRRPKLPYRHVAAWQSGEAMPTQTTHPAPSFAGAAMAAAAAALTP